MKRRFVSTRRRWLRSGLTVATVLAGAAGFSASASGASVANAGIHKGGSATFTIAGFYATLDPAVANVALFTGVETMEAVFGPGLDYVNPTTGAIQYGQAIGMTPNKKGNIWTMPLHPGMKFSDGTPFTASAVCNQLAWDRNPASGSKFVSVANTTTCTAVNKTTVRWTLQGPNYYWPAVVSQDFPYISSPTALAAEGTGFAAAPVGAGPFKLTNTVQGVSQTFMKNKYYALFAPGQPYLDSITIEASGTLSQIVAALQSGQAQISDPINTQYATEERAAGMQAAMHSTAGGAFLALNTAAPPFNNLQARQAVYDVISRVGVANVWTPGNPVTTNLFPTTSPFYNAKYNFPPTNPSAAQTIFNSLAAAGTPVKFTILWPNSTAPNTPAYIQSLFAGMQNVTVSINEEPQTQYASDALNGNYQMTAEGLYNTSLIPAVQQWFETGGNLNYMRWSDPKADAALQGLYSDKTKASQTRDWDAFMTELNTQIPVIWTQQGRIGVSYNPKVIAGIQAIEFGNATLWGTVHLIS
jgi:peptide/nickel transport system substrate-binding protein